MINLRKLKSNIDISSWTTISGSTAAISKTGYILDSLGGSFTVLLPTLAYESDIVGFVGLSDINSNNIIIDANGKNINGDSGNLILDSNYCYFSMIYTGDLSVGWVSLNTIESCNTTLPMARAWSYL